MINLVHYQPWSLMNHWQRELDHVFATAAGDAEPDAADRAAWVPSVDVQEESGRYVVRADLPGVTAKDIDVSVDEGVLTIRGERRASERVGKGSYERIERVTGTFARRFTLPDVAHAAAIKANYTDGVLEVVIPKTPRAEATRISITVN